MELYPGRRSFLFKKPFHKYRLRITAVAAELGTSVIFAGNHLGGNTVAVTDEVIARISKMQAILPGGMRIKEGEGLADFSLAIRESIQETLFALQLGAVLATLTVFGFLRRWRPTLIVGISIPFSLITTFGVMWVFDFTLNTMTLLAMTLAVGVVIDDAIVVLENIERHREQGESPREAASKGAKQVAFAATAATVAIAAVFVPVVFARGIVGSFLSEFGATVASAVLLSLVIALTLTPMLCSRFIVEYMNIVLC